MKKSKREIENDVIEMQEGVDGKFHALTVQEVKKQNHARNDAGSDIRGMPKWYPYAYELIGGFVHGLGAIENFMENVRRVKRRRW